MPTLAEIASRVASHQPQRLPEPPSPRQRAAVALVLAGPPQALSACFIRRAQREGDPWSGHMALPGGRGQIEDPTPRAIATRETAEEVGLPLHDDHFLGDLDEMPLRPDRPPAPGVLSPFAFYVGRQLPALVPEPAEVAEATWIELSHLWDDSQTTTLPWTHEGRALTFPGIAYGDHVIWGLTLRVLFQFAQVIGRPLPLRTHTPKLRP